MNSTGTVIQKIQEEFARLVQTLNNELSDGVYKEKALLELELAEKNSIESVIRQPQTK